jgi:hypothetical protein
MRLDMRVFAPIVQAVRGRNHAYRLGGTGHARGVRRQPARGLVAAPHDPAVADSLAMTTTRYREPACRSPRPDGSARVARRDALQQAVDVLWFYYGQRSGSR